jgi:hypothetical protein
VGFGVTPFVVKYSCGGGGTAEPSPPFPLHPPPLVAEPEAKHPPVQGWTVDLPQLWKIAKEHDSLFANGVKRGLVTTVTRLRGDQSQCGEGTVFNVPPAWKGPISSELAKRLVNEQGRRTVIELVERELATPGPLEYCDKGHYLIIDAHSGADLETGTYLHCVPGPAA